MSNLPRNLGHFESDELIIKDSRFGIVLKWGEKFFTLTEEDNPMEISRTRAIELIEETKKGMGIYKDVTYRRGKWKYGVYIQYNDRRWTIPKDKDLDTMSEQEIHQFIQSKLDRKL